MKKWQDHDLTVRGTRLSYRVYIDPSGGEKPLLVVEAAEKPGVPLDRNREAVAKELCARLGTTPDQATFLEQAPDGALKQTTFTPNYIQTVIPDAHDLAPEEAERAAEKGEIPSAKIPRYSMDTRSVKRAAIEARLGEKIEPHEARQNKEISQMKGPQIDRELEIER